MYQNKDFIEKELERFNENIDSFAQEVKEAHILLQTRIDVEGITRENEEQIIGFYPMKILGLKGLLAKLHEITADKTYSIDRDIPTIIIKIETKILDSISEAQNDHAESLILIAKRKEIENWLTDVNQELNDYTEDLCTKSELVTIQKKSALKGIQQRIK